MEWSHVHRHKDGTWGRDSILRDPAGRSRARVEAEDFKTVIEKIRLAEGEVYLEKTLTGRVIGGWFHPDPEK